MKLTKRVCARCIYVCGVLRFHTELTKNYKGAQLRILTTRDSIRYCIHAIETSQWVKAKLYINRGIFPKYNGES